MTRQVLTPPQSRQKSEVVSAAVGVLVWIVLAVGFFASGYPLVGVMLLGCGLALGAWRVNDGRAGIVLDNGNIGRRRGLSGRVAPMLALDRVEVVIEHSGHGEQTLVLWGIGGGHRSRHMIRAARRMSKQHGRLIKRRGTGKPALHPLIARITKLDDSDVTLIVDALVDSGLPDPRVIGYPVVRS